MADDRRQPHQGTSPCDWDRWRQSRHGTQERGLNTKIHLAVDAHGMPVRFFVTAGTTADCAVAAQPIEGFAAQYDMPRIPLPLSPPFKSAASLFGALSIDDTI